MASQVRRALPADQSFFKSRQSPDDRQRFRLLRKKKLRRIGPKTEEWEAIRAELKVRFKAAGITRCELRYEGCMTDWMLGFAHGKKRRNCSERDLWTVILSCNPCHDRIEVLPEKEMQRIVLGIIANRKRQP